MTDFRQELAYHELDPTVGPQVNYAQQSGAKFLATTVDNGKHSNGVVSRLAEKGDNDTAMRPLARKNNRIWIVGLIILCFIIALAAGIGGGLGTRKVHTITPEPGRFVDLLHDEGPHLLTGRNIVLRHRKIVL